MLISTNGLEQLLQPGYNLKTVSGFTDIYSTANRLFFPFKMIFERVKRTARLVSLVFYYYYERERKLCGKFK